MINSRNDQDIEKVVELDEAVRSGKLEEQGKDDPTGGRHVNGGSITDVLKSEDLEKHGDRTNAWIRSFNE